MDKEESYRLDCIYIKHELLEEGRFGDVKWKNKHLDED
jgi:hypothetical protein